MSGGGSKDSWCTKSHGNGAHGLPCTSNSDSVSLECVRKSMTDVNLNFFFVRGVKLRVGGEGGSVSMFS